MLTTASLSLFSAYAEVFLGRSKGVAALAAFLCLRRGVSLPAEKNPVLGQLFSAYAEVFPLLPAHA